MGTANGIIGDRMTSSKNFIKGGGTMTVRKPTQQLMMLIKITKNC